MFESIKAAWTKMVTPSVVQAKIEPVDDPISGWDDFLPKTDLAATVPIVTAPTSVRRYVAAPVLATPTPAPVVAENKVEIITEVPFFRGSR